MIYQIKDRNTTANRRIECITIRRVTDVSTFQGLTKAQLVDIANNNSVKVAQYTPVLQGEFTYQQIKNIYGDTDVGSHGHVGYGSGVYFEAGDNIVAAAHIAIARNITTANLPANANTLEFWSSAHIEWSHGNLVRDAMAGHSYSDSQLQNTYVSVGDGNSYSLYDILNGAI